jgi:hypothetical protein
LCSAHPSHRRDINCRGQNLRLWSCHGRVNNPRTNGIDADKVLGILQKLEMQDQDIYLCGRDTYVDSVAPRHTNHGSFATTVSGYSGSGVSSWDSRSSRLSDSRAAGRPTIPSWLAILTMLPLQPGLPSCVGKGSCLSMRWIAAREDSQHPR